MQPRPLLSAQRQEQPAVGQAGNGYVILPPEDDADIMVGCQKTDIDCLKRGVILGTNTKLGSLTEDQRRRTEATLSRVAQFSPGWLDHQLDLRVRDSVASGAAFDTVGTEFLGLRFKNDTTGETNYGWIEFVTTSATGFPATIVGYAYNNTTGGSIVVGQITNAVPEPGTTAALGFGALSFGAAGVRRWRKATRVL